MPRGGRRTPGPGKTLGRPRIPYASQGVASRVLRKAGELARWMGLLDAKDERLRFDVLRYLTDKRDGKPAQSVITADTRETVPALPLGDFPEPLMEQPKSERPPGSDDEKHLQ